MRRTIGDDAMLSKTLGEYVLLFYFILFLLLRPQGFYRLTDLAYKAFFDLVEAHGRSLLRFLHASLIQYERQMHS